MESRKIIIFAFILGFSLKVYSQVVSFEYDPNKVNKELSATMDSLYQEDQKYRCEYLKLLDRNAPKEVLDSITTIIKAKDASNLKFATQLIDKYGWISPQDVGFLSAHSLFLIIQHSDLNTQKKYYPLILKAEKEGKILSSNVALLEDRIAVREGRRQTYGSQIYRDTSKNKKYVYPLVDFKNLDVLRKSRGLSPMKEYLNDWDESDYKSYLPYANKLLKEYSESQKK